MRIFFVAPLFLAFAISVSCGKKSSSKDGGSSSGSGGMFDASKVQLNLSGAVGLAKMGGASGQNLLFDSEGFYADGPAQSGEANKSKLAKVTNQKTFEDVLGSDDTAVKSFFSSQQNPPEIYKAPTGDVYLFFPMPLYSLEKQSSCQLFKASAKLADLTAASAPKASISCVVGLADRMIQPQFWGVQGSEPTLQFDKQGRIYVRAYAKMGSPGGEILRIDPASGATKVMVNANIYVTKFFATPRGGLYYVGQAQGGSSYFRYVEPSGGVQQVAEGQFGPILFLPLKDDTNDRVIFAGPKPSSGQSPSVPIVSNELLRFDPTAGDPNDENRLLAQVSDVVTRGKMDGYSWMPVNGPWEKWRDSCKSVSVSSGIQSLGYQGVIIPEENGDFLFINASGNAWQSFGYANPGKIICEFQNSDTSFTRSDDEGVCAANISKSAFNAACAAANADVSTDDKFREAFSRATTRGSENSTPIIRLSAEGVLSPIPFPADVQVKKIWKLGADLFYLQAKNSSYSLKKWIDGTSANDRLIKTKFEIYSLARSSPSELVFSGLDFLNNEFGVGYVKLDTLQPEMKDDLKVKISDIVPLD